MTPETMLSAPSASNTGWPLASTERSTPAAVIVRNWQR